MTEALTIKALASTFADAFVKAKRDNGDSFYKLNDAPEWMTEAVRSAHGGMMPDDWRYEAIYSVLLHMADVLDDEDGEDEAREAADEGCDSLVDVYNLNLTAWLGSHLSRIAYCDDAADEFGAAGALDGGIIKLIQLGQMAEYREIWESLVSSLQEQIDDAEE